MKSAYQDLTEYIDVSRVKALNITKESNPAFLFEKCLNVIESRADPQILLMVPFKEPVKLFSIAFEAPNDDSAPTEVDLFLNSSNVSFSDVDSMVPTQSLTLSEEDLNPTSSTKLQARKWENVHSIVIFIKENRGSFSTCLGSVKFFGKPTSALLDISGVSKGGK